MPNEMASTTTTTTINKTAIPLNTSKTSLMRPIPLSVDIPAFPTSEAKEARPSSPQRALSDPFPPAPARQLPSILGREGEQTPKSAGNTPKSPKTVKFGKGGMSLEKAKTTPETGRKELGKRRHSHEPRLNVHTECGRHSDDWLFGGFSVAETMKRLWEKKG